MILAATVLARGGCLVSHDVQEFRRIREDWTE
jgi:hypothetical protein